ncbi:transposase [Catenulispora pinisilvae]|uniref:transposase n=1 Tax=Catenulispora pinisilvae TaxID=2705253 RepID=UPI0022643155|nr:transposase [Catenulispora pinisilvae]
MKKLLAERDWLAVFYLPAYTPTLNPVEGVWSALKRSLANLAPRSTDALALCGWCQSSTSGSSTRPSSAQ